MASTSSAPAALWWSWTDATTANPDAVQARAGEWGWTAIVDARRPRPAQLLPGAKPPQTTPRFSTGDGAWSLRAWTRPGRIRTSSGRIRSAPEALLAITSPKGRTAALLTSAPNSRMSEAPFIAKMTGLGALLDARSKQPSPAANSGEYRRWWAHMRAWHAAVHDLPAWCPPGVQVLDPADASVPGADRTEVHLMARAIVSAQALEDLLTWGSYGVAWSDIPAWKQVLGTEVADVPGPEGRAPYRGKMPWHDAGFDPQAAAVWMPVGDDDRAAMWWSAGRSVEDALAWRACMGPDWPIPRPNEDLALQAAGWTPERVARAKAAMPGKQDRAFEVWRWLLTPIIWSGNEARTRIHEMSPERLLQFLENGFTDQAEIIELEYGSQPPTEDLLRMWGALRKRS